MTNEHQMAVDAIRRRLERWSKQPMTMNKGEALGALLFLLDIIDTQQELLNQDGANIGGQQA